MEFQVIFERLERSTPEEIEKIKERLVQKFKVPSDKAEKMIRTAPIVVKKGLNLEQANKYKSALESIGVSASIKEVDSTESSQKSPNLVDQSTTAEPATAEIDPGKTQLADTFTAKIAKTTANVEPPKGVNLEKRPLETTAVDEAFPIFYDPSLDRSATSAPKPSPQPESRLTTAENLDPLKTVVAESEKITQEVATQAGISLNKEDVTKLHPVQPSVEPAQWWEGRYILNLPFDESTSPLAPMSTGRISAQPNGIGMAHPMLDKIAYENIKLVAVFQAGINVSPKIFLDIFTSTMAKPVRFDTELINYASFGLSIADSNIDRVSDFVRFLLDKNRDLVIDLPTYKFLKDKGLIKKVAGEREVEKYCGKLQGEVEKGLRPNSNQHLILWREALELLSKEDPWGSLPVPHYPPANTPPNPYATQQSTPLPNTPNLQAPYQQPPSAYPPPTAYMPPVAQPYPNPQEVRPPQPGFQYPPPPLQMGKVPMPVQMHGIGYGYLNPTVELDVKKAQSNAQKALLLSIFGLFCSCFPLSIWGLIKAQDATQVMDNYGIEQDRNKAVAAKILAIIGLIMNALFMMAKFLR